MNESFKIVDLKSALTKEKKEYYKIILYSNLEYLITVFTNKDTYDAISKIDFNSFDVSKYLRKVYDKKNDKFSYYIDIPTK